jgi:hypothetical protein
MSFQGSDFESFEEIQNSVMIILIGVSKNVSSNVVSMIEIMEYLYVLGGKVHFMG